MPFNNGFGIPAPPFDTYYGAAVSNIATAILFTITAFWVVVGSRLYKTLMPNGTSTAIDLEGKVSWS